MKKQLNQIETHTCQCGNAHKEAAGEICDICMGVIPAVEMEPVQEDWFDEQYFEELENFYDTMIHAA